MAGKKSKKGKTIVKLIPKSCKENKKLKRSCVYTTERRNNLEHKIELMKYNTATRKHELFVEDGKA